ncbi:MAG: protein translocase SEC61 complex subunit gamma [Candidatus Micrarchaeia archaeon]
MDIAGLPSKTKGELESFYQRSMRVLRVSYRPTEREFWSMVKTTALGMALIGIVGFAITLVFSYI